MIMNPKLLELAELATTKYDRLGFEIPYAQPDLEAYGLLIINECISAIESEKWPSWAESSDAMEVHIEHIKHRFGLE